MTGCQSPLVVGYYKHLFYILRDWKIIWSAKPEFIIYFEVTWDLYPTVYSVWLVPLREQCVRQPWISTLVLLPPRLCAHQERKKAESMWKLEDWEECWEIVFWRGHGHCNLELMAAVLTCTKPAPDQVSPEFLPVWTANVQVLTLSRSYCWWIVSGRGRVILS